jgi:hypothetical protein
MSSEEPIYIRRSTAADHLNSPLTWCSDAAAEGRKSGATFFRTSGRGHRGELTALLIEGWAEQPEDQGEPRWEAETK